MNVEKIVLQLLKWLLDKFFGALIGKLVTEAWDRIRKKKSK